MPDIPGTSAADSLQGGADNDTLRGLGGADTLRGLGGDDWLYGDDGNDRLYGDAGADTLKGGFGNDILYFDALDTLGEEGWFNETYVAAGTANRWQSEYDVAVAVDTLGNIDLANYRYIEEFYLSGGNDDIRNTCPDYRLYVDLGAGDDFYDGLGSIGGFILGGSGKDTIRGSQGADRLAGGSGQDWLDGRDGEDFAVYSESPFGLRVSLAIPADNTGEAAGDIFISIEGLVGSGFNDSLAGNSAANTLVGGFGNDILTGDGSGDTFRFAFADIEANRTDTVTDYTPTQDVIQFQTLRSSLVDLSLTITGSATSVNAANGWKLALTGTAGQIIRVDFSDAIVRWDSGTNAAWSHYTDYINSTGQITDQDIINDNGTRAQRHIDVSQTTSWTEYTDYFNASLQLIDQEIRYDSGVIAQRHLNQAGTQEYTDYVNSQGVLLEQQEVINLNGTREQRHFDPFNQTSDFQRYTDFFNASSQITAQSVVFDNNFQDQTSYAVPGSMLHGTTNQYDAAGVLYNTFNF
jgi:Ca2+-binding RTX toxin-like protein